MQFFKKSLLFWMTLFLWLGVNELNIRLSAEKERAYYGFVHFNPDTNGYRTQIEHYLDGHGFTLDPEEEPAMSVRRTPGYPLFYAAHRVLFGIENAHFYIRYTQIILFALSCYWLLLAMQNLVPDRKWASWAAWLYALSPFVPMYSYYIVTEAVVSTMVIFVLWVYSCYYRTQARKYLYWTALVIGALFLTRPLMGILLPAVFLATVQFKSLLNKTYLKQKFLDGVVYALGFATLVAPWVIRNYIVTDGDIVLAEKFYHGAPMKYGRGHIKFRTLNSVWSNTGNGQAEYFGMQLKYQAADVGSKENATRFIKQYMEDLPQDIRVSEYAVALEKLLWQMYDCYVQTDEYLQKNPAAKRAEWLNLSCQDEVEAEADQILQQLKKAYPVRYYLLEPLQSIGQVMLQSNTHHIYSLNPKDKSLAFWQKAIKGICLILNFILFVSLFSFIIAPKSPYHLRMIAGLSFLGMLLVLVWGVRHLENRYLIPFMPFAAIAMSYFLVALHNKFISKNKN